MVTYATRKTPLGTTDKRMHTQTIYLSIDKNTEKNGEIALRMGFRKNLILFLP